MCEQRKGDQPEVIADEALDETAGGGALAKIQASVQAESDQKTIINGVITSIVGNSIPAGR